MFKGHCSITPGLCRQRCQVISFEVDVNIGKEEGSLVVNW